MNAPLENSMIDASFDVTFKIEYQVLHYNDSFLREDLVREAALKAGKEAASKEIARQVQEAQADGTLNQMFGTEQENG